MARKLLDLVLSLRFELLLGRECVLVGLKMLLLFPLIAQGEREADGDDVSRLWSSV